MLGYFFYHPLARWMMVSRSVQLDKSDIKPGKHYIFAINHSGAPDFFVVFFGLPLSVTLRLVPYRFFIANRFFKKPLVRWMALSYGGFPAKEHTQLKWGLDAAKHALNRNETLVIFPEGKVSKVDRKYPPKRGVAILAKMPNVLIIPTRVKWHRNNGYLRSYDVTVGKPIDANGLTADQIMNEVYDLEFATNK